MSRLFFGMMFAVGLSICTVTVGCGDGGVTVIEQDPVQADAEAAEYKKQMEEEAKQQLEESKSIQ